MNRRFFALSGLAALILHQNTTLIHAWAGRNREFSSELTGAGITWDDSFWTSNSSGLIEDGWEAFNLVSDAATLHIQFISESLVSSQRFPSWHNKNVIPAQEFASDDFEDGGWAFINEVAGRGPKDRIAYCEYQLGAFPEYTLQIRYWGHPDTFHESFAKAQEVDIAGAPPFLFLEESGVETLDIAAITEPGEASSSASTRSAI